MNQKDLQRLVKIDTELLEIEEQIVGYLEKEKEGNRNTLLMSRVLVAKRDRLKRIRSNMQRTSKNRISRRETYNLELVTRKETLDREIEELHNIERNIANLIATASIGNNAEILMSEISGLKKLLRSQQLIVMNKERAYKNWCAKSENDLPAPRENTIVKIKAKRTIQVLNNSGVSNEQILNKLKEDSRWEKKPTDNNATIDMLTNPPTDK